MSDEKTYQSSYWALSATVREELLGAAIERSWWHFQKHCAFQYVNTTFSLLLYPDHWRGRHTVHDQLCPCSDGEHTSQTHQDTGVLDSAAHWVWLCYTEVSLVYIVQYGAIVRGKNLKVKSVVEESIQILYLVKVAIQQCKNSLFQVKSHVFTMKK